MSTIETNDPNPFCDDQDDEEVPQEEQDDESSEDDPPFMFFIDWLCCRKRGPQHLS